MVNKITPAPIKCGAVYHSSAYSHDIVALAEDGKSFAMLTEDEVKTPGKGFMYPDIPVFNTELNPSYKMALVR